MSACAIVPIRDVRDGKTRLAGTLDQPARQALLRGMLGRVLDALRAQVDEVVVVTTDTTLRVEGATVILDGGSGLNAAIQCGIEYASKQHSLAIILAADTPHVTAAEIERLLAASSACDVVVVPDHVGTGTNALGLRLPSSIELCFGEDSFAAHLRAAQRASAALQVLPLAGLARDLDVPADLETHVPLSREQALAMADSASLDALLHEAEELTLRGFGRRISYSRKVFIPLTQLCRDVCHYCTFAGPPRRGQAPYLATDEVLRIARAGVQAGCQEALFTLGDQPEVRFVAAGTQLAELGFASTLEYLEHCARLVFEETGLLPHLNAGTMNSEQFERLRRVSASMGTMLESSAERLAQKGGPHHRSPDKHPVARLATLRAAGEAAVPYTTGILVGIGETRRERVESLLAIRDLHERYGHIQELIVQNFRAKPGTRMARSPEPSLEELLWSVAVARLVFGPSMSIQAPPNLSPGRLGRPDRRRHQRLGRRVTRHTRSRQSGGAVARARRCSSERLRRQGACWSSASRSSLRSRSSLIAGSTRRFAPRCYDRSTPKDTWRTVTGRPVAGHRPPARLAKLVQARSTRPHATALVTEVLRRATAGERLGEQEIAALFDGRWRGLCGRRTRGG